MAKTLVRFLQDAADRFGSRPALFFKPSIRYQRWTYTDLWEGAGRVASLLQLNPFTAARRQALTIPDQGRCQRVHVLWRIFPATFG